MKHIKVIIFTAVYLFFISFSVEAQKTPPGKETPDNPYQISTITQLKWMHTKINDPFSCSIKGYGGKAYKLINDINLASDPDRMAIGKLTEKEPENFSGKYCGGISGTNRRSKIINRIALNPVIDGIEKSTSMSYAICRIINNDPNSGIVSNCYASKSLIIKLTNSQKLQTIAKTTYTTNNGADLTVNPETIINVGSNITRSIRVLHLKSRLQVIERMKYNIF